jgi:DNA replication protein DnaC
MAKQKILIDGIPARYRSFRPSDNKCAHWNDVYVKTKKAIDNGAIIALAGIRGVGKTQLSICACGYAFTSLKKSVKYIKAFELFLSIRDAMKNGCEASMIKKLQKPYVLVIDAFEATYNSDFEARYLDYIIDTRYDQLKPTILIANKKHKDFAHLLGASNASRIKETGYFLELKGSSKR